MSLSRSEEQFRMQRSIIRPQWLADRFASAKLRAFVVFIVAVCLTIVGAPNASVAAAQPCRTCPEPDPQPDPPPPPTSTSIGSISPGYGWAGDVVTISGVLLNGASVTMNGQAIAVTSQNANRIVFTVPAIPYGQVGPLPKVPVTVTGPHGTATTHFQLSPVLTVSGMQYFGGNNGHPDSSSYTDGWARATMNIDRYSGSVNAGATVHNVQFWLALTINMSVVWADTNGQVVGFTAPHAVSSTGVFFTWPVSDSTTQDNWTSSVEPNPGVAAPVGSGTVVMVRDHTAEFLATLTNAKAVAETVASLVSKLAALV